MEPDDLDALLREQLHGELDRLPLRLTGATLHQRLSSRDTRSRLWVLPFRLLVPVTLGIAVVATLVVVWTGLPRPGAPAASPGMHAVVAGSGLTVLVPNGGWEAFTDSPIRVAGGGAEPNSLVIATVQTHGASPQTLSAAKLDTDANGTFSGNVPLYPPLDDGAIPATLTITEPPGGAALSVELTLQKADVPISLWHPARTGDAVWGGDTLVGGALPEVRAISAHFQAGGKTFDAAAATFRTPDAAWVAKGLRDFAVAVPGGIPRGPATLRVSWEAGGPRPGVLEIPVTIGVAPPSESPPPQPIGLFQTQTPLGNTCYAALLEPESYGADGGAVKIWAWRPARDLCTGASSIIVPALVQLRRATTLVGGGAGYVVEGYVDWPSGPERVALTLDPAGAHQGVNGWEMPATSGDPPGIVPVVLGRHESLRVTGAADPWLLLEARPVAQQLLPLAAGSCEPSPVAERSAALAPLSGPGPVYVSGVDGQGTIHRDQLNESRLLKIVWLSTDYQGPVLVRPAGVQGALTLGLAGADGTVVPELRLPELSNEAPPGLEPGYRTWVTYLLVPGTDGCAALQVDGLDFTEWIIVRIAG